MEKLYKISTNLSESEIDEAKSHFDFDDEKLVKSVEYDIFIDVIEDDGTVSYVACNDYNLDLILSLFKKHSIFYELEDVTIPFLRGQIDVDKIYDYLAENLTIDDVLDKITEMGINSLSDLDRKILDSI